MILLQFVEKNTYFLYFIINLTLKKNYIIEEEQKRRKKNRKGGYNGSCRVVKYPLTALVRYTFIYCNKTTVMTRVFMDSRW